MHDFGQPLGPLGDPMGDPFFEDPFEAMANVFDNPTDLSFGLNGAVSPPNPDYYMDASGRALTELEESIKGTVVPPTKIEEPMLSPEPPAPITEGYTSEGPPPPPEGTEHPWNTLQPPPAARLYYTPHGIMSPLSPSHHRPGRAGAGIRNANASDDQPERYCEWAQDWVPLTTCTENCEFYDPDTQTCTYYEEES